MHERRKSIGQAIVSLIRKSVIFDRGTRFFAAVDCGVAVMRRTGGSGIRDGIIRNRGGGGIRNIERGVGDAAGDFFGAFEAWKENLFQVLRKDTDGQNVISEEKLSVEIVKSTRNLGQITDFGIVMQNKILVDASKIGPTIRHLEIKLPKGQTYRTGDYLAVLPTNPLDVVY